jgi:hypothetical protein
MSYLYQVHYILSLHNGLQIVINLMVYTSNMFYKIVGLLILEKQEVNVAYVCQLQFSNQNR